MILFEDKYTSSLATLFREAYPIDFITSDSYCCSNTNLLKYAKQYHTQHPEETVFIFMDLVPSPDDTRIIYNKLRSESIRNDYYIVLIPIPCAEYLFLKAFQGTALNKKSVKSVSYRDLVDYENSELANELIPKYKTSMEKFCKGVYSYFYCNCLQGKCKNFCRLDKRTTVYHSIEYLKEYPWVPNSGAVRFSKSLSNFDINRVAVDEINKLFKEYAQLHDILFKPINYIK